MGLSENETATAAKLALNGLLSGNTVNRGNQFSSAIVEAVALQDLP
jgi:hypothetical protein